MFKSNILKPVGIYPYDNYMVSPDGIVYNKRSKKIHFMWKMDC